MNKFDKEILAKYFEETFGVTAELQKTHKNKMGYYNIHNFVIFDQNDIFLMDKKGDIVTEFWPEVYKTHEEVFEQIYELTIHYDTIFKSYLLAKQRDSRIDDIFND